MGLFDCRFFIEPSPIVLILEPKEGVWPQIFKMGADLLQRLPGRIKNIYFLGNGAPYCVTTAQDFTSHCPAWFQENNGRPPFITPILKRLTKERFNGMAAVILSELPFDIEDWEEDFFGQINLIGVGNLTFPNHYRNVSANVSGAIDSLTNRVKQVSIQGDGFVPLYNEITPNTPADVEYSSGKFTLTIRPSFERIDCHLQFLCQKEPTIFAERNNGVREEITPKIIQGSLPQWTDVPTTLKPIVEAGCGKKDFNCLQCHNSHPYDTMVCPSGLPILQGMPLGTCILFCKGKFFPLEKWHAYPLNENQTVITNQGNRYSWKNNQWEEMATAAPYEVVDDDCYALLHQFR